MFWTMLRGVVLAVLVGAVYGDPSIDASSGSVTVKPDQGGSLYVQPPGAPREAVAMARDITALTAVITTVNTSLTQVHSLAHSLTLPPPHTRLVATWSHHPCAQSPEKSMSALSPKVIHDVM
jgi:cytochrome c biogenesis factor